MAAEPVRAPLPWWVGSPAKPAVDQTRGIRTCESLSADVRLEIGKVIDARRVTGEGGAPDWCQVTVEITQPRATSVTTVWVGLPVEQAGGKTIIWHGLADQLISPEGTIHYFNAVRETLGARRTSSFFRLYLLAGISHGRGGSELYPVGFLDALVAWVEEGRAPRALLSERRDANDRVIASRPLCPYPQAPRYRGRGSIDDGSNYVCR